MSTAATKGDDRPDIGVDQESLPRIFLILVAAITLIGLLLRLPSFKDSLFGDEISTYYIVVGNSLGRTLRLVESAQETTPPLYFILAWATKGLLANPAQSIRLVSLITGTAAIPLTFLLGLWTVGRRAALVGASCVALSPFMIFFSTEARPYMLVLFLALLSSLALLRALDSGRLVWWVAYAVCTCGAAYSHYTVVFFLVAQLAWALWTQPRARPALLASNVAVLVGFLPWINGLREDLRAPNFIGSVGHVNLSTWAGIAEHVWIGHPIIPIGRLPGNVAVALGAAGLSVGLVGLALKMRTNSTMTWRPPPRVVLIVVLTLVPTVLVGLYSVARVDILGGGNIIASWPSMALAIGFLVTRPARPMRSLAIVLTLAAFAIGGIMMLRPSAQRLNVDAAVAYITRIGSRGDPIVSQTYFGNPLTEVDVALADAGQTRFHPVIRLGIPKLSEQLPHLEGPDPQPIFVGLPITPPQVVARQAVTQAHKGTFLLVTPNLPLPVVLKRYPNSALSVFLRAVPRRFRIVEHVTYPGFSYILPESVYVFRDTGT